MKTTLSLLAALVLLGAACENAPTAELRLTPPESAATSSPLPPPTLTASPVPQTPTPTLTPVEGTVSAQINVRAGPGTNFTTLGLINPGQKVQILGRDQNGQWYMILYPTGPQGRGWISAAFVTTDNPDSLPVAENGQVESTSSAITGKVMQQLNVRSGPGTEYDILGTLLPNSVVILTGKNELGSWLQIEYAGGPDGRGWVTAAYVQLNTTSGLPVLNPAGTPVTPAAQVPTPLVLTPTPTIGPALPDGDSPTNPAVRVTFSPPGTRQFAFSSDVSAPQGDLEDWIEFTPYASPGNSATRLVVSLSCRGNATLGIELWQNGQLLSDWGTLVCGDQDKPLTLPAGQPYQLRLFVEDGDGLHYVRYTLSIRNSP